MPQEDDDRAIIRLDGVAKRFETPAGTVVALDRVDLAIAPGQLVVVLGPSGCGRFADERGVRVRDG